MTDDIRASAAKWDALFNAGDIANLEGAYASDASIVPAGGVPVTVWSQMPAMRVRPASSRKSSCLKSMPVSYTPTMTSWPAVPAQPVPVR